MSSSLPLSPSSPSLFFPSLLPSSYWSSSLLAFMAIVCSNNNSNNKDCTERRNSRLLQYPHCAANCRQHVSLKRPGLYRVANHVQHIYRVQITCNTSIVCKSRATHLSCANHVQHIYRVQITCNTSIVCKSRATHLSCANHVQHIYRVQITCNTSIVCKSRATHRALIACNESCTTW